MDNLLIRHAVLQDARAIAMVQVDTWRTTYKGIIPQQYLDSLSYDSREQRWRGLIEGDSKLPFLGARAFVHVAERNNRVIGFVCGGDERRGAADVSERSSFDGELYAIYILADHQSRGLGRRLVQALTEDLREVGLQSMLVWVLAENPSRHFYEAMGGQLVERRIVGIGGASLDELGYGWQNLSSI